MTCREFQYRTDALSLRELSQARDQQIAGHVRECQKCAAWLQQQRTLAVTMQTLQARTASCVAGPETERELLQAFRQRPAPNGPPEMMEGFTPIAMRLSRFFEIGAYVAVAAALLVGLFLGVQVLEKRSSNSPIASQSAQPSASTSSAAAEESVAVAQKSWPNLHQPLPAVSHSSIHRPSPRGVQPASEANSDSTEVFPSSTDEGYVALMFCDPLSCSTDSQVVRMELPAQTGQSVQTADLVVGYDGVVRAVRIVN
jgi:hypothetical protein